MRDAFLVDLAQELPHGAADLDVHAGGGLVQDQQPRLVHQGAGDHQAALHAAREGARHVVALLPQGQLLQVFLGALLAPRARDAVEPRLVHHDVEDFLELVEVEFLRHQADAGLGRFEFAVDVVVEHRDLPPVLFTSEVMMPMVVVLPAPLGPSKAQNSPSSTSKSMPLRAWTPFL